MTIRAILQHKSMTFRPFALFVAFLIGGFGVTADSARAQEAPVCGAKEPGMARVRTELTLDESATTNLKFKRKTSPRDLSLVFMHKGCNLFRLRPPPRVRILPAGETAQLPAAAISLGEVERDAFRLYVRVSVDPLKFEPGTYGGAVILSAPYLAANRTPVSVSRSEDNELKPFGIGALAAIAGVVWFALLKFFARNKLAVSWWWLVPVTVAAASVGGLAALNNYWDQEVWTLDDNVRATVVAAFSGATTGSMAMLLGAIWQAPKK